MKKQNKKRISIILVLTLIVGTAYSPFSKTDVRAVKVEEDPPIVVIGDDPSASDTPLPTLSPEEEKIRKKAADAMEKTKSMPILGCRAPIGGGGNSETGKVTIFADIVQDFNTKVRHETEVHVNENDKLLNQNEAWYDINTKNYYAYDKKSGQYIFEPGGEDYSRLEYLSLDFYLDYVPNVSGFSKDTPAEVDLYDGRKVKCDVIRHMHSVSVNPYINDTTIEPNAEKRYVSYAYYIGQEDGLIYRIEHHSGSLGSVYEMAHVFYYPKESLSIPKEYTDNPVLADGVGLLRKNFWYVSYSKGKKTYLSAYEYEKQNSKEIKLISSIKLGKRTYTVNAIDQKAFFGMEKLKKVTIPKSITSIGKGAFAACINLETLVVKNKTLRNKLKKSKKLRKKIAFDGKTIKG